MSQGSLDFGRQDRVDRWHRDVLRALHDAVDAVGLYNAAGACDAGKADLRHALAEREGRHMRTSWALAIADIAPAEFAVRIVTPYADAVGCTLVTKRTMTADEENVALKAALKSLGPVGQQVLRDALGGRAPP